MEINGRKIGDKYPPYIIAEVSANHNGSIDLALETIKAAWETGVDAVKIQTYEPQSMTIECDNPDFFIDDGLWKGKSLYELYDMAHTPYRWHKRIFDFAREHGITLFSSPFDEEAVDLLESLSTPAYKVASFEMTDFLLVDYICQKNKPVIISTGMADESEITESYYCATNRLSPDNVLLLHCVSGYPAPVTDVNLATMVDLKRQYGGLIGLSDHTLGNEVALAAVALGANVIEKHFTLDRNNGSPDAEFSLEPNEMAALCHGARTVWSALGKVNYERKKSEASNVRFRRSLYVVKDIKKGEAFTSENIRRIRPGHGLPPGKPPEVLGKKAISDLTSGTALAQEHIYSD